MASSQRKTTVPKTRPSRKTPDAVEELASSLASGLNISKPSSKGLRGARTVLEAKKSTRRDKDDAWAPGQAGSSSIQRKAPLSSEQRPVELMRTVNASSQALSTIVQSGWKASIPSNSSEYSVAGIASLGNTAFDALNKLRELQPGNLDCERAASTVIGKLVYLEMYNYLMEALEATHASLTSFICADACISSNSQPNSLDLAHSLDLLFLPFPSGVVLNPAILTLVSSYCVHALVTVTNQITSHPEHHKRFLQSLSREGALLSWFPICSPLPSKHLDSIANRAYSALTKSFPSSTAPDVLLGIRTVALKFLLLTSSLEQDAFWSQALRFGGTFMKGASAEDPEIDAVAHRNLSSAFRNIVESAENRTDKSGFLRGRGFLSFCESWLMLAKRENNTHDLEKITQYIQSACSSGMSDFPGSRTGDDDCERRELQAAEACAIFASATTICEQALSSSNVTENIQKSIDSAIKVIPTCSAFSKTRMAAKLGRALERLRRAASKMLDQLSVSSHAKESTDIYMHTTVKTLLIALVDYVESSLQIPELQSSADMRDGKTGALETLFVLARTSLSAWNPDTYCSAYDFLARAAALAALGFHGDRHSSHYLRCVSGTFYHLAGTLYQAGKHGAAVRFLREGCSLGSKALRQYEKRTADVAEDDDGRCGDAWIQLSEQLHRRWELLGVCYTKIGERKLAHEAFVECVKTYPYSSSFFHLTHTMSSHAIFSSSSHKQLGATIDRLTYLGACDLFMGSGCSLKQALEEAHVDQECIAAVLARQIEGLEASKWKDGVKEVIRGLLRDSLQIWDKDRPIRRAKVLLSQMEHYYHDEDARIDSGDILEDMTTLLAREGFDQDAGLAHFRLEYLASAHLWRALHIHRQAAEYDLNTAIKHFEEATKALRATTVSVKSPPRKSTKLSSISKKDKASVKQAQKKTTRTAQRLPTTPKPRKATGLLKRLSAQNTPPRPVPIDCGVLYDDFDRFIGLLRMSAQLLGLSGQVVLRMQMLIIIRRLTERHKGLTSPDYHLATADLAHEYLKLGKIERASSLYGQVLASSRDTQGADELRVMLMLRHAQCLVIIGKAHKSSTLYADALDLSETLVPSEKNLPTSVRIRQRACWLERAAVASNVFATIQLHNNNTIASVQALLRSLRLWNRAVETIIRLHPPPSISDIDSSNPFEVTGLKEALPSTDASTPLDDVRQWRGKPMRRVTSMDGMEWRVAEGLLSTLFALMNSYFIRGSPRETEYFSQYAYDFAKPLNAVAMVGRALARKGEGQLHMGHLEEAQQTLLQATKILKDFPGPETVEVRRLQGHHSHLSGHLPDAQQVYAETMTLLGELEKAFFTVVDGDTVGATPRKASISSPKSAVAKKTNEAFLPTLLAAVLSQRIWLLRDESPEQLETLLEQLLSLSSPGAKAEGTTLAGKVTLHDVYGRFQADMFLNSLTETTIAVPMGMSGDNNIALAPRTQDAINALMKAEALFWSGLELVTQQGRAIDLRDSALSLVLIRAFHTSLGKTATNASLLITNLLDLATCITLRWEMLEAIDHKFPVARMQDDLTWPTVSLIGSPFSRKKCLPRQIHLRPDDSDDEGCEDDEALKTYWAETRKRYQKQFTNAECLSTSQINLLPPNWTVIHINVTEDKNTLFISRQRPHHGPLVFCVPLKGRPESDDDEHLTFEDALNELKDIIQCSDKGTREAMRAHLGGLEARAAWWAERNALDTRMKELLENIEFCWLGAFKTILSEPVITPPDVISALRVRFDKVFQCLHRDRKQAKRMRLDDDLLECFSTLSPDCRDEEIEDLIYFVMDLYQFHGISVPLAEVDVIEVAVHLRMALEEYASQEKSRVTVQKDSHTFLVLDRNLQGIPWESLPILRGQSVSRIPCISFLVDRLQFARCQRKLPPLSPEDNDGAVDRYVVDPSKTYYVLNPSGDLAGTEKRFSAWLKEMDKVGWEGVIGKTPSEQQLLDALSKKDMFIYFGHGGGEQYLRSHKVRHLPRCAATMLWGCSSGALRDMGVFDRVGTPYAYMLAGCPTLVANLWDVTDRDIDKFSQSVFDRLRLRPADVQRGMRDGGDEKAVSVVTAVARSRDSCKLRYLTGAAPVVYGIPFYL